MTSTETESPLYDLRIKLVFPHDAGRLPSFEGADDSWWDSWLRLPESERGHLRTYTVRADAEVEPDLWETPAYSSSGERWTPRWPAWATTATGSTRGSRGSRRWSPACAGCW